MYLYKIEESLDGKYRVYKLIDKKYQLVHTSDTLQNAVDETRKHHKDTYVINHYYSPEAGPQPGLMEMP